MLRSTTCRFSGMHFDRNRVAAGAGCWHFAPAKHIRQSGFVAIVAFMLPHSIADNLDNHIAFLFPAFHIAMRIGNLLQWKTLVDDWLEDAVLQQFS